jgi:hypothetical protein
MSRRNPKMVRAGIKHRGKHKSAYYSAMACIQVSPEVKQGLIEIAEIEGRTISWVVAEVFKLYFGLRDDTKYLGIQPVRRITKLRRVK